MTHHFLRLIKACHIQKQNKTKVEMKNNLFALPIFKFRKKGNEVNTRKIPKMIKELIS